MVYRPEKDKNYKQAVIFHKKRIKKRKKKEQKRKKEQKKKKRKQKNKFIGNCNYRPKDCKRKALVKWKNVKNFQTRLLCNECIIAYKFGDKNKDPFDYKKHAKKYVDNIKIKKTFS